MNADRLRIAVALGKLGSRVHGTLDASRPFDDEGAFATGTVSGFWTLVWGLAELGHEVDAFADVKDEPFPCSPDHLGGAHVFPISCWEEWRTPNEGWRDRYDAYLSILESDLLDLVDQHKPRICVQWLNDFSYSKANPLDVADLFVSPSRTHAEHMHRKASIPVDKIAVVPLSSNLELFIPTPRRPFSVAYASSPDRGLHHLLEIWPEVRRRVPGAELRVYYRITPWLDDILTEKAHHGSKQWKRADAIRNAFDALGTNGENGLFVVGPLTTSKMAAELCRTEVLAYPCDPVKFTEGFSVTVLDACAAGCIPVVSGIDALPELWMDHVRMIPGRPTDPGAREEWIRTITGILLAGEEEKTAMRGRALRRAAQLSRRVVARQWDEVIRGAVAKKKSEER